MKKGRYLSIESKIEKYPSIIRSDKASPIVLSDIKQRKNPFKVFFEERKLLRDSATHYSPGKEMITRKPDDWINIVKTTSQLCIEISQAFWIACYPNRTQPEYLGFLDYDKHLSVALERLNIKDEARNL